MNYEAEQVSLFDQDTWSGRTCPEHSQAENPKARTSRRCSKSSSKSSNRKLPLCLCLKRVGPMPGASMMIWDDGALLGEYTMHSFGESPREENVSRLSQILEDSPHPRYSLSAKACQGILNRAERRGKQLPEALEKALREQSLSKNEPVNLGGKGILIQPERTGALSTLNNQSVFNIGSYHSKAWESDNPHSGIYEAEVSRTLDALNCGSPACNQGGTCVVAVDCRNGREQEVNGTLQAKSNGGVSHNLNNVIRTSDSS